MHDIRNFIRLLHRSTSVIGPNAIAINGKVMAPNEIAVRGKVLVTNGTV